jgi:hypothetical protein
MRISLYRQDGEAPDEVVLAWQTIGIWNPHHSEGLGALRPIKGP